MKKLAVTLLLLAFIAGPSFAMKIITNKDTDRTVPSRCMRPGYDVVSDTASSVYYTPGTTTQYGGIRGYQAVRFDQYYKPVLKRDFRNELIGTRWHYPNYTVETPGKVTVKGNNASAKAVIPSKYMREAADYFVVDTIHNPNTAVEAKHEGYYQ
jgi:hypothetical protein